MFASGVVKLTSNCPTWWGLTGLNHHYESQVATCVCVCVCVRGRDHGGEREHGEGKRRGVEEMEKVWEERV